MQTFEGVQAQKLEDITHEARQAVIRIFPVTISGIVCQSSASATDSHVHRAILTARVKSTYQLCEGAASFGDANTPSIFTLVIKISGEKIRHARTTTLLLSCVGAIIACPETSTHPKADENLWQVKPVRPAVLSVLPFFTALRARAQRAAARARAVCRWASL
jgi:hypothetical protein